MGEGGGVRRELRPEPRREWGGRPGGRHWRGLHAPRPAPGQQVGKRAPPPLPFTPTPTPLRPQAKALDHTQWSQKRVGWPRQKCSPGRLVWAQTWQFACCPQGVHGHGVQPDLLPTPHPAPQPSIPGHTSQAWFAPESRSAQSDSLSVMRQGMCESWACMRARTPRHEYTASIHHSCQNRASPTHTVRGQSHVSQHTGALPKVMLVSTPASTTPTRSGHQGQAHGL